MEREVCGDRPCGPVGRDRVWLWGPSDGLGDAGHRRRCTVADGHRGLVRVLDPGCKINHRRGLCFNGLQSMALVLIFVPLLNKIDPSGFAIRAARIELVLAIGGFATAYTAVMLYLGRRKLLRFQVAGAGSGSNVLATDWTMMPIGLLRCTASGGTLNLLRKELHLLWPLAPLMLIALGMLLAVVPLRFVSGYRDWIVTIGISIVLIHGFLASILAGTLSLGEERSLGTSCMEHDAARFRFPPLDDQAGDRSFGKRRLLRRRCPLGTPSFRPGVFVNSSPRRFPWRYFRS